MKLLNTIIALFLTTPTPAPAAWDIDEIERDFSHMLSQFSTPDSPTPVVPNTDNLY